MQSLNRAIASGAPYAPLIMRVILGAYLLWHGIDKFNTGLSNVEGFFDSQGVPVAGLAAPAVAIIEVVVGLALILGIGTRIAALTQILVLLGALVFVRWTPIAEGGIIRASELDLMYIVGLIGVMLLGPGTASLDEAIDLDDTVIDLRNKAADKVLA